MKKHLLFLFFILMKSSINLPAQPSIQWEHSYGGSSEEIAFCIQQTFDGGYIVAGHTFSNDSNVTGNHGGEDCWIIKIDGTGAFQWQKSLGGTGEDGARSIRQTADGGYIVAGTSGSNDGDVTGNHGNLDYWVVKLDNSGTIQWQKSLGGSASDVAESIQQTTDGGYIVAGRADSDNGNVTGHHGTFYYDDYWIVKLDSSGTIQWQKSLGGTAADLANFIQQTTDGGYIVTGYSYSNDGDIPVGTPNGAADYWTVKLDGNGNIQWQKCLGGGSNDEAHSIKQTTDGGYIVAGRAASNNGDVTGNHSIAEDAWIVKLNGSGAIQWQKCLGGTNFDWACSIQQTPDEGYVFAGFSNSIDGDVTGNHGDWDFWVVKSDSSGTMQWQKSLGGTGQEIAYSMQQTADGGYVVAGFSGSTDGDVTGNHGSWDFWIVKLSSFIGIEENNFAGGISVFPNPSTGDLVISSPDIIKQGVIQIFNVIGENVFEENIFNESNKEINLKNISKGIYLLVVTIDGERTVKKIVKE